MIWVLGVLGLVFVAFRLVRGRREVFPVFPWQPISTLHSSWSKRTSKETKAALDAATALLR